MKENERRACRLVMFQIPCVLVCCMKHTLVSAHIVMLQKTGVHMIIRTLVESTGKHVFQRKNCLLQNESEKIDKWFKKLKRSKIRTVLASAQNHMSNEVKDVMCQHVQSMSNSCGAMKIPRLPTSFPCSATCTQSCATPPLHESSFTSQTSLCPSSALGEVNTAIIDLLCRISTENPSAHR